MLRTTFAVLVCACAITAPAFAEVVIVSLPGLTGPYPVSATNTVRSVTVQLPRTPDSIHSVSLLVTGTSEVGVAHCGEVGTANVWPMEFIGETEDGWWATHEPKFTKGNFEFEMPFEPIGEAGTWDFFLDGEAEFHLSGAPWSQLWVCDPILYPTGLVTEVTLIIDGEFPLPIEHATWGRIKALYR